MRYTVAIYCMLVRATMTQPCSFLLYSPPLACRASAPSLYCSCFFGAIECRHRLQNSAPVISSTLFSMTCLPQNYNKKMVCCRCVASSWERAPLACSACTSPNLYPWGPERVSAPHPFPLRPSPPPAVRVTRLFRLIVLRACQSPCGRGWRRLQRTACI